VTYLWLVALMAVLITHCDNCARMGGQHRWFHASNILMLMGMLYMFASMRFNWAWFPSSWWVVIFCASTAAIVGWMILRFVQRRPFSFLWALALVMQAAMIYMWMPNWAPALTWTLVVYYGLETVAWLGGGLDDSKPSTAARPSDRALGVPVTPDSAAAPVNGATVPTSMGGGLLDDPKPAMAAGPPDNHAVVVPVAHDSAVARAGMAIMAASMGYMFAAMQLMR
jgi:hypothetical protein